MSEFDLIRQYFRRPQPPGVLGVGDDCALLPAQAGSWAISTDLLLEGRHFFGDIDPASLGHKALAVNLSDLAAMGAEPRGCVLGLGLPSVDHAWIAPFADAFHALAEAHHCPLVGGDTTRSADGICISVTVFGHLDARRALRRDGARAGDDIWVSGPLGDAELALHLLLAERAPWRDIQPLPVLQGDTSSPVMGTKSSPPVADDGELEDWIRTLAPARRQWLLASTRERLERPQPRVALGRALAGLAHAAIDISDGLVQDLGHILRASGCGAALSAALLPLSDAMRTVPVPIAWRMALGGGDAYELCFTAPASERGHIQRLGRALGLELTRIGETLPQEGLFVYDGQGQLLAGVPRGFDHFA